MRHVTERQEEVLRVVATRGPVSRSEVARKLGCSVPTAAQHLMALRRKNLIESTGIGQYSRWVPARRLGEKLVAGCSTMPSHAAIHHLC